MNTPPHAANDWLPYMRPGADAGLRLFCFPYAGGNALTYRRWVEALAPQVEVCPVQLPGRGRRLLHPPFTRLGALVETLGEVLLPHLDRPFAFFGHSMGAMISFELTRLLRRRHGLRPAHLFLSARRAPHFPPSEPPSYHLPEPEFVEKVRELNGTPAEVLEHAELMQLLIPLLRADFEVVQTYEYAPGPPLDCPVSVYGGLLDAEVSREHLEGWAELAGPDFELRMFAGGHFFIQTHEQEVVRAVGARLALLAPAAA